MNRDDYRHLIDSRNPLINTGAYARIERAPAGMAWRAVCVYHLSPSENGGMHGIFVDCLDTGDRWASTAGLTVQWTWEGRRDNEPAPARPFEKRPPEPRAQVDLWVGQNTSLWIQDGQGAPSDKVHGLHSNVENGLNGNTWGHNSFVVIFKMSSLVGTPPITPPPTGPDEPTQPTLTLEQRVSANERAIAELAAWRRSMEGD